MEILYLVLGVIAFIVLIVIVLIILRKMTGNMKISLPKYNYKPGENITGTLSIKLKKPVEGKLLQIGLIGVAKNTRFSKNAEGHAQSSSKYATVYSFHNKLDKEKTYIPGDLNYNFNILIPSNILAESAINKGVAGTLVKSAQILSGNITNIKWYVTADFDIPGLNMKKRVQINIG